MQITSPKPATPVPDELMDRFHKANEHFHEARQNLEAQMRGIDHRHQQRVNAATDAVLAAEREVEEATDKIEQELHGQNSANPGALPPAGQEGHVAEFEPLR